jgi:hypothetical protein
MGDYAVEGIANLLNKGARWAGWLQAYRLVCYLYNMDFLLCTYAGWGDNNGICTGALHIGWVESGYRG